MKYSTTPLDRNPLQLHWRRSRDYSCRRPKRQRRCESASGSCGPRPNSKKSPAFGSAKQSAIRPRLCRHGSTLRKAAADCDASNTVKLSESYGKAIATALSGGLDSRVWKSSTDGFDRQPDPYDPFLPRQRGYGSRPFPRLTKSSRVKDASRVQSSPVDCSAWPADRLRTSPRPSASGARMETATTFWQGQFARQRGGSRSAMIPASGSTRHAKTKTSANRVRFGTTRLTRTSSGHESRYWLHLSALDVGQRFFPPSAVECRWEADRTREESKNEFREEKTKLRRPDD